MNVTEKRFRVDDLVGAFKAGSLTRNEEYQRGEAWSMVQKAGFIDSLFRRYPVPPIFLYRRLSKGLGDATTEKFEIVDGQQRLSALRDFLDGKYALLSTDPQSKLRLPHELRSQPAPWAKKIYDDLQTELRHYIDGVEINVYLIDDKDSPVEVRDLFIRLQSGTALSRQQIRDAWPGNIGPFIETIAGKLGRHPSHRLFQVIDKRGQRSEDELELRDRYIADRQTCAQLLKIFIAREYDPRAYPSVSANELDALYHEHTDFDKNGSLAQRFKNVLGWTADVFTAALSSLQKRKVRRIDVTCIMAIIQQYTRNPQIKVDKSTISALAKQVAAAEVSASDKPVGKATSGTTFEVNYKWWLEYAAGAFETRIDPRRTFDERQKIEIYERDHGVCQICNNPVNADRSDAEYDHYPLPHYVGGQTEISNGRLVHKTCHPRGRPPQDAV